MSEDPQLGSDSDEPCLCGTSFTCLADHAADTRTHDLPGDDEA